MEWRNEMVGGRRVEGEDNSKREEIIYLKFKRVNV